MTNNSVIINIPSLLFKGHFAEVLCDNYSEILYIVELYLIA
jgi:hypothetical protein